MSAQTTIRKLAMLISTPVEKLLRQLAEAGMEFSSPDQAITSAEKLKLLGFLRRSYSKTEKSADEVIAPSRVTVDDGEALDAQAGSDFRKRLMGLRPKSPAAIESSVHMATAISPAEFLRKFGITCFYHFTDTRNLPSIRAHGGLLPWSEVKGNVVAPGGNDWSHDADAVKGQDNYVHLCFLPEHPMEFVARRDGRILESRFLRIDPSVIHTPGILFCPDVANKSGVEMMDLAAAVSEMDFEIIAPAHKWLDPSLFERKKRACKYELLVPAQVPLSLISGI